MELCVGVEYMNFRATCKQCHLAAPHIRWCDETASRRLLTYSLVSPWLMVLDQHQGVITFTDPLFGDKYVKKIPPELIDFQIYCSMLMFKIEGPMVFYNPFTGDIRELPEIPYLESFCFSAPPTSPECQVVGFTTSGVSHVFIHFVGKEPFWYTIEAEDPSCFRYPTFSGQDIYALRDDKGIDVYKRIGEENCSWEVLIDEVPKSYCKTYAKHFLAKCDQHLFQVIVGEFGESVEVFNLNDSREEWEKVDSLGKHMICLCETTCLCIEAKTPEMENKIYFPRFHSSNGKIVFYSLETCRYHTFAGKNVEESFEDLFETGYYTSPHTWIEPSWS